MVTALNAAGEAAGLYVGMALTDARAILPALRTRPAEPENDTRALAALADWCTRYTPWVNIDGADGLWLDVTGCAHLFGGEVGLLADIARRLQDIGVSVRLGLADTPGAAWAVARQIRSAHVADGIVPPGGARAALAPLPIDGLRLTPETVATLKRLGLARIGQLYDLPRAGLKRRFASAEEPEAVLRRLDQAFGVHDEPVAPLRPAPAYRARLGFAEPLTEVLAIETLLPDLVVDLCRALAQDHQGARRLTLAAYRVDGRVERLTVAASRPTRDTRHLQRLFRERVAQIDVGFGIDGLILSADRVDELAPDQSSFAAGARLAADDAAVGRLVDRLANKLGPDRVMQTAPHASHLPEKASRRIGALDIAPAWPEAPRDGPPRPFRMFDRPEPIEVTAEVPEGPPISFRWRRLVHRIARAEGPERIAPEWWLTQDLDDDRIRDYYQVEDAEGRRFWLYREGLFGAPGRDGPPRWYMHGLFA